MLRSPFSIRCTCRSVMYDTCSVPASFNFKFHFRGGAGWGNQRVFHSIHECVTSLKIRTRIGSPERQDIDLKLLNSGLHPHVAYNSHSDLVPSWQRAEGRNTSSVTVCKTHFPRQIIFCIVNMYVPNFDLCMEQTFSDYPLCHPCSNHRHVPECESIVDQVWIETFLIGVWSFKAKLKR